MSHFKLFLAIILAVATMQSYASQKRSENQNLLHDAVYEFQNEVVKPAVVWENSLLNKSRAFFMAGCSVAGMGGCMQEDILDDAKQLSEFEIALSHNIMTPVEIVDIAKKISVLSISYDFRNEPKYKNMAAICNTLIYPSSGQNK